TGQRTRQPSERKSTRGREASGGWGEISSEAGTGTVRAPAPSRRAAAASAEPPAWPAAPAGTSGEVPRAPAPARRFGKETRRTHSGRSRCRRGELRRAQGRGTDRAKGFSATADERGRARGREAAPPVRRPRCTYSRRPVRASNRPPASSNGASKKWRDTI